MEELMAWLSQYWGMAIVGGITVGSVIMLVIMAIKFFISMRSTTGQNQRMAEILTSMIDDRKVLTARLAFNERVQATTFKALSYLTMNSKLPTEDKIMLNQEFIKLGEDTKTFIAVLEKSSNDTLAEVQRQLSVSLDTAKQAAVSSAQDKTELKENVGTVVGAAIAGAATLIEKYTKE